jgi:hypothetical protein
MCLRSIVADNLYFSGLANNPFFSEGRYAMPDTMDAEATEIEPDAMDAVAGDAFQGTAMEADTLQGDAMEANAFDSDASNGDVYDSGDRFEHESLDADALESVSEGKKLPNLHPNFLTTE